MNGPKFTLGPVSFCQAADALVGRAHVKDWKDHPLFRRAVSFTRSSQAEIERVTKELPAFATGVARHVPFAEDAVAAFYAALDPKVPATQRFMVWAPLIYFVNPFDAIPDLIPGLGFVDDGAAIAAMLAAVGKVITTTHRAKARDTLGLPALEG